MKLSVYIIINFEYTYNWQKSDIRSMKRFFLAGALAKYLYRIPSICLQYFVRISTYGFDAYVGRWAEEVRKRRLRSDHFLHEMLGH